MKRILRRPSADRDLVAIYRYYAAAQSSLRTADRFFADADRTFRRLADRSGIGTRYHPQEPLFADLRYFPLARYRDYLVFYRPVEDGIEVYRVLHGARDIPSILTADFLPENETAG